MKNYVIFFLLVTLSSSCITHQPAFEGTPLEKHSTLEGTGFTQQNLDALTDHLENKLETTGMLILQDGKVVYEYGDLQDVGYLASCRKSILSILYGKYVENGTIDLNQTIGEIGVDEDKGLLDIEKMATVDPVSYTHLTLPTTPYV